jgi:hypothetical protein
MASMKRTIAIDAIVDLELLAADGLDLEVRAARREVLRSSKQATRCTVVHGEFVLVQRVAFGIGRDNGSASGTI